MSYAAARMTAAAFRSIGVDATVSPDSNHETLAVGGCHASGEECLPHKITLGDFLRVCQAPGFDPGKVAFFMPSAPGPCRFGQYAPYLRRTLDELGYHDAVVFSPNSMDNYGDLGDHASDLMRAIWMGFVAGDAAFKLALRTRPYETEPGRTDAAFRAAVRALEGPVADAGLTPKQRVAALRGVMEQVRDGFRAVPADYVKGRPLIGLVGEIFCRLNEFSNDDTARRIEQLGGECWVSDISEWVWYTNWCRETDALRESGWYTPKYLKLKLKSHVQHSYERTILAPLQDDLAGYEEPPDVREVLRASEPYLPATGALGEMTLSVGKAIYLYRKGADGVIDISPFTCMNGIVSEAVYPAVSADHDHVPIRTMYFDKTNTNLERDLEIFLDLAHAYQRRKRRTRVYPACFD